MNDMVLTITAETQKVLIWIWVGCIVFDLLALHLSIRYGFLTIRSGLLMLLCWVLIFLLAPLGIPLVIGSLLSMLIFSKVFDSYKVFR